MAIVATKMGLRSNEILEINRKEKMGMPKVRKKLRMKTKSKRIRKERVFDSC